MKSPTDVDRSAPVLTDLDIEVAAPRDVVWRRPLRNEAEQASRGERKRGPAARAVAP